MHITNLHVCVSVPTPRVDITIHNAMMIVGQSLLLECIATTVRGVKSQVDITWININTGKELNNTANINASMANSSSVQYKDSFYIPLLTTDYDGIRYECEVMISASSHVMAANNFTVDVSSKHISNTNKCYLYAFFVILKFRYREFVRISI